MFPPECDGTERVFSNLCLRVAKDPALQPLFDAIDESYLSIVRAFRANLPNELPLSHPARAFLSVWDNVSFFDADEATLLLYDGSRIIPPASARPNLISLLHASHQGITKTKLLAQQNYFWPGMNSDIKNKIDACDVCQKFRPSHSREPLAPREPAVFPMQEVSTDLFEHAGKSYVTMVDRYSGYLFSAPLTQLTTDHVVKQLKHWFYLFGFPKCIVSDNGPQYRNDFKKFCTSIGAEHVTSSPYFPQSNGQAESAVKNAKYLLIKCIDTEKDYQLALSEFRRVPREDKFSPAQLMFGYKQRGLLPTISNPITDLESAEEAKLNLGKIHKRYFDKGAVPLTPLVPGTAVLVQHPLTKRWDKRAKIISATNSGRSYQIEFSDGRLTRRNRRFLKLISHADSTKMGLRPVSDVIVPVERSVPGSILKNQHIADTPASLRRSPRLSSKNVHYAD